MQPRTHGVGKISSEAEKLIKVTRQSFFEGIKYAKAGNHLNDICTAIYNYNKSFGYGVVRDLVGHGVGSNLHEDPQIPNFKMKRRGIKLEAGMTLAIEPMVNIGRSDVCWLDDDWTVVTEDESLSAHYENTILITDGEPEILSLTSMENPDGTMKHKEGIIWRETQEGLFAIFKSRRLIKEIFMYSSAR